MKEQLIRVLQEKIIFLEKCLSNPHFRTGCLEPGTLSLMSNAINGYQVLRLATKAFLIHIF